MFISESVANEALTSDLESPTFRTMIETSTKRSLRSGCPSRQIFTIGVILGVLAVLPVSPVAANVHNDTGSHEIRADTATPGLSSRTTELVIRALSLLGVNYKRGGNTPQTGLDCSGLVRFVFYDTLGLLLPRRSEEISRVGMNVQRHDLQPGDLVFYNTMRRTFSHVGIYLGDGRFIHAPASGGIVRIEKMDLPYWLNRFDGARRLRQET